MKEKIQTYILQELLGNKNGAELSTSDDILSTGMIDSLGIMQLITFIENSFEIAVPPNDMVIENFMTIDAIERYIEKCKE